MSITENFRKKYFDTFEGASLVLSEANRLYLSQLHSSDGAILITKNNSYLIVDFRYYEIAKATAKDFNVVLAEKGLLTEAKNLCEREGIKSLTIEDDYVTVNMDKRIKTLFEGFEFSYFGDLISKMREVKTQWEIDKIIKAQEITDAAFEHILGFIHKGLTENEVAIELDSFMRGCGAQESAFRTICVSGKKSSLPHGEPSNDVLSENSFLTMDFGARFDGYCSDMTRTVVVGRASDEMKRVYDIVLSAQKSALDKVKAGVLGKVVDFAARSIISDAGFGENFGHSTGHGLGIDVHESPSFSPNYSHSIPQNSVLSVEPGIYIENKFGVRIEDIVVVQEKNALNLTKSDKKLIEIY